VLEEAFLNIYLNAIDAMEDRGKLLISTEPVKNKLNPLLLKSRIMVVALITKTFTIYSTHFLRMRNTVPVSG